MSGPDADNLTPLFKTQAEEETNDLLVCGLDDGPTPEDVDINGFKRIKDGITTDSGAVDFVSPETEFPDYPLEPSPGSIKGLKYTAAGGQKLPNRGQNKRES